MQTGGLRQVMAWIHTWFGLSAGFVLMVCFFFGTLSVFDRELDRWGQPELRHAIEPMPSFDRVLRPALSLQRPVTLPSGVRPDQVGAVTSIYSYASFRDPQPYVTLTWKGPADAGPITRFGLFDAATHRVMDEDHQLKIGTEFFYPLHYSLTLETFKIGYWIVAFAAMMLIIALVTGVVMHRKVFREFFTFRPRKGPLRSSLDLHNMTGVVALPFHLMMAFTGLLIFAYIYFPIATTQLQPLATGLPTVTHPLPSASGAYARTMAVDPMVEQARALWRSRGLGDEVVAVGLHHIDDANGYVSVYRSGTDRVALVGGAVHFSAVTGRVLFEDPEPNPITHTWHYLEALHLAPYRMWLLRWLYVIAGLMGVVCIATGTLFFVRRRSESSPSHARALSAVAVTSITGMLMATCAMFLANRVLPESSVNAFFQKGCFFLTWIVSFVHAWWLGGKHPLGRSSRILVQQLSIIGALAIAAVLANWITTGDALWKTLPEPYWPVAGVDLALLTAAVVAWWVARRLQRREVA